MSYDVAVGTLKGGVATMTAVFSIVGKIAFDLFVGVLLIVIERKFFDKK